MVSFAITDQDEITELPRFGEVFPHDYARRVADLESIVNGRVLGVSSSSATTGALLGSTHNSITATTTLRGGGTAPTWRMERTGTLAAGNTAGGFTFDAANTSGNLHTTALGGWFGILAEAPDATHGGIGLVGRTTPLGTITPQDAIKVTTGADMRLDVNGSANYAKGGVIRQAGGLLIDRSYTQTDFNWHTVSDGVLTASSPVITSATAAFTENDLGYQVSVTADAPLWSLGRIISVDSATQITIDKDVPSSLAGSGVGLTFHDVSVGTPINVNLNVDYNYAGAGGEGPWTQYSMGAEGGFNAGPRGLITVEGKHTYSHDTYRGPVLVQTFPIITNSPGSACTHLGGGTQFGNSPQWIADTDAIALGTIGGGVGVGFQDNPQFYGINGGTLTSTAGYVSFGAYAYVLTGADIAKLTAFYVHETTISGTLDEHIGFRCESLFNATTNIGMHMFDTDATFTAAPSFILSDNTYTYDFTNVAVGPMVEWSATTRFKQSGATLGSGNQFLFRGVYESAPTAASSVGLGLLTVVLANNTYRANTKNVTSGQVYEFHSFPHMSATGGATLAMSNVLHYRAAMLVDANATLTERYGLYFDDATNNGTLTRQRAIYIEHLTGATTNIGLWNNSTTVNVGVTSTISSHTSTITVTSTYVYLNNTSGGAVTLDTGTTIAAGVDGQSVTILNTSANAITLQDKNFRSGSGLQLASNNTRTLSQYYSISFVYNATLTAWIETNFGSAGSTGGTANFNVPIQVYDSDQTFTSNPWPSGDYYANNQYTLDFASAAMGGLGRFGATVLVAASRTALSAGMQSVWANGASYGNVPSATSVTLGPVRSFSSAPTYTADGATLAGTIQYGFYDAPTYTSANAGTLANSFAHDGYRSQMIVKGTATLITRKAFSVTDATLSTFTEAPYTRDAGTVTDGGTVNGNTNISSPGGHFLSTDTGATITGTGIPAGTTFTYNNSVSGSISHAATANGSNIVFTFTRTSAATGYSPTTRGPGVITTQYGLYCPDLTAGGTNYGIYNLAPTYLGGLTVDRSGAVTGATGLSVSANALAVPFTSTNTATVTLQLVRDSGAALAAAGIMGTISFRGAQDASSTLFTGAAVRATNTSGSVWSSTSSPTRLEIMTANTANPPVLTARAVFDSDGSFGVGSNTTGTSNSFYVTSAGAVTAAAVTATSLTMGAVDITTGWWADSHTWVYASASSFTISGVDLTTVFTKGTRVRCTNNSVTFYGVVISSAFSTNTTVTLAANADYALANSAITVPCFSYAVCPPGYPTWFGYAPTFTGYSADPTSLAYKFKVEGTSCTLYVRDGANGTSNATTVTMTLPITCATVTNGAWYGATRYVNSGAGATTPGVLQVLSAGTVVSSFIDWGVTNGWGATLGKRTVAGTITYPI